MTGSLLLLIAYFIICTITGFIAAGNGTKTERLSRIWSVLSVLLGIACSIYLSINEHWSYTLAVFAIFLFGLKAGGRIMMRLLSKPNYNALVGEGNAPTVNIPSTNITISRAQFYELSLQKSRIMKQIEYYDKSKTQNTIKAINNGRMWDMIDHTDEEKRKESELYQNLFDCMNQMPGFHEILEQHNVTPELLKSIASRIKLLGYPNFGDYYIPVALIALSKPLVYMLENIDIILHSGNKQIIPIVNDAIRLL